MLNPCPTHGEKILKTTDIHTLRRAQEKASKGLAGEQTEVMKAPDVYNECADIGAVAQTTQQPPKPDTPTPIPAPTRKSYLNSCFWPNYFV